MLIFTHPALLSHPHPHPQPCMDGDVIPVKFVTITLIWHSYVLWNISWDILFLLLRQPCTIRYEIHVISICKWALGSTYFITKSLLFHCENSATVTNSLYQTLRSPCKFRYDIPVFPCIPIFGVTKALFFLKKKLVTWRVATFSTKPWKIFRILVSINLLKLL